MKRMFRAGLESVVFSVSYSSVLCPHMREALMKQLTKSHDCVIPWSSVETWIRLLRTIGLTWDYRLPENVFLAIVS